MTKYIHSEIVTKIKMKGRYDKKVQTSKHQVHVSPALSMRQLCDLNFLIYTKKHFQPILSLMGSAVKEKGSHVKLGKLEAAVYQEIDYSQHSTGT